MELSASVCLALLSFLLNYLAIVAFQIVDLHRFPQSLALIDMVVFICHQGCSLLLCLTGQLSIDAYRSVILLLSLPYKSISTTVRHKSAVFRYETVLPL